VVSNPAEVTDVPTLLFFLRRVSSGLCLSRRSSISSGGLGRVGPLRHTSDVAPQKFRRATETYTSCDQHKYTDCHNAHISAATILTSSLKSYAVSLSHSTDTVT